MSKKQSDLPKISYSRLNSGSTIFGKKTRKTRKIKIDNVKLHKSSLYYVAEEPTSRLGILEKFLDFLLDDKIKSRIPIVRKLECEESESFGSLSEVCVTKDFQAIEEDDLQYSTVVGVEDSKLLLEKPSVSNRDNTDGLKITQEPSIAEVSNLPRIDSQLPNNSLGAEALKSMTENPLTRPFIVRFEKIVFHNGNVYEGQTNEYLMHGNGKFTWDDNTVYNGEFKDGYISGKGQISLPDLSSYRGEFCNGFFHGKGFLNVASTPIYYYGDWTYGRKDGSGWILYGAGDWYEGEWKMDMRHGNGYRTYKNGAKYKGDWIENKKQGKGKMLFQNDDYYNGGWYDDMFNGYGEYTWDIVYNKTFCFPVYNWYKGAWRNGERHGIGIMNFGTECGAKYAGTWRNNFKHGPGIMICGNGLVIESNPLFEYDKPVHKSQINFMRPSEGNGEKKVPGTQKSSYYEVLELIKSHVACSKFDEKILANITANSENIPPHMFVKLVDSISGGKKMWCPLRIPTHTIAEEVDLKYFVDLIFDDALKNSSFDDFRKLFEGSLEYRHVSGFHGATLLIAKYNGGSEGTDNDSELIDPQEKIRSTKTKEQKKLKNIIIIYLLKLKIVYEKYAAFPKSKSMLSNIDLDFKPVLVRFFLWQLLRDLGITDEGVQLVDIDSLLWENPASCLDTKHYPFEPIYFYQYVMYLFGAAWLCYKMGNKKNVKDGQANEEAAEKSIPSNIFRHFLDTRFESIEMLRGSSLGDHLNIVPLNDLYDMYVRIAEPMTVKSFIKATYRKKDEELPCYHTIYQQSYPKTNLRDGYNAVPVAHDVCFIHEPTPLIERSFESTDARTRTTLFTFRTLGKKAILETVSKICPKFNTKNMDYKITFLEFYEIIVLLAFQKAEEEIKKGHVITSTNMMTSSDINIRSKIKKKKVK